MDPAPLTRSILAVAALTAAVLLVPLVAMHFTSEVQWTPGDFVVAAVLLLGAGITWVLATRRLRGRGPRVAVTVAVLLGLGLVWAELAVGILH